MSDQNATAVLQPPYLKIARALDNPDVQSVADMSGLRVAMAMLQAEGNPLPGEVNDPPLSPEQIGVRRLLALRVLQGKIDRPRLTRALLMAPDVAMAVANNENDPAGGMMQVNLENAWVRNWTDFASVVALDGT